MFMILFLFFQLTTISFQKEKIKQREAAEEKWKFYEYPLMHPFSWPQEKYGAYLTEVERHSCDLLHIELFF